MLHRTSLLQSKIENAGYLSAFNAALEVRLNRKIVYGDTWKSMQDWELLAIIKHKVGRLEDFIINRKNEKLYESRIDNLKDIINYSLFLLENEMHKGDD